MLQQEFSTRSTPRNQRRPPNHQLHSSHLQNHVHCPAKECRQLHPEEPRYSSTATRALPRLDLPEHHRAGLVVCPYQGRRYLISGSRKIEAGRIGVVSFASKSRLKTIPSSINSILEQRKSSNQTKADVLYKWGESVIRISPYGEQACYVAR